MTTIPLYHFAWYLTAVQGITWRDQDHLARKIVKALKGESFGGEIRLKIGGQTRIWSEANAVEFVPLIATTVARQLKREIGDVFSLVPIPNSDAVAGSDADYRMLKFARSVAKQVSGGCKALDVLRWDRPKEKAHQGKGPRDPAVHYDRLRICEPPAGPIVLLDDVLTTGSQLVAAYRRLRDEGHPPVAACVVGRTTQEQQTPMVRWLRTELSVEEEPLIELDEWPF